MPMSQVAWKVTNFLKCRDIFFISRFAPQAKFSTPENPDTHFFRQVVTKASELTRIFFEKRRGKNFLRGVPPNLWGPLAEKFIP